MKSGLTINERNGAPPPAGRRLAARKGFTLIEAAMTTVIIGVGFMASLQLLAAGTATNADGAEATTGLNLAKNVREMLIQVPFAQVKSYNAKTYTPPIDSGGHKMDSCAGWTQTLKVQAVDPDRLTLDISTTSPEAFKVTVLVTHNGRLVSTASWLTLIGAPPAGP